MKAALGSVGAALAASACCIGPVVFSLMGAGALSAAATVAMLGGAFYTAYRPAASANDGCDDVCTPTARRTARLLLWIAAVAAAILIAFPYYIGYLM